MDTREQEDQELAEFDVGFQAGLDGEPRDPAQTAAWQRGYRAAVEAD